MKTMLASLALATSALALAVSAANAQDRGLSVVSWGGTYQDAQREIYFEPFAAESGVTITEESWDGGYGVIAAKMETPPSEFLFHARNPARTIMIGGKWVAFGPVGGPPNCFDLDRGRRPGTLDDNSNFLKLSQFFNCIHTSGDGSVDALDVASPVRHLHIMRNKVRFSDKVPFVYATGRDRLLDSLEITRLARGISHEQMSREPSAYTVINTNSPLKLDRPMAMGVIEMARRGQICVATPFTLLGAMAPVTLAGALVDRTPRFWPALLCRSWRSPVRPSSMAASRPTST